MLLASIPRWFESQLQAMLSPLLFNVQPNVLPRSDCLEPPDASGASVASKLFKVLGFRESPGRGGGSGRGGAFGNSRLSRTVQANEPSECATRLSSWLSRVAVSSALLKPSQIDPPPRRLTPQAHSVTLVNRA